jgi:cobalt-zinc-cadmium efflux system outer membrane protein
MKLRSIKSASLVCFPLFGLGCASLPEKPGFDDVERAAERRTGAKIHWNQGSDADRAVDESVRQLLSRELTADGAVQFALLNNPRLQAKYESLGVAQADLVQAGLLRNPVFDGSVRWPNSSPRSPNVELSVTASFLDLLFIPARKRIAKAQFEQTKLEVADAVVEMATEVRSAFFHLQGAQQMLELRQVVFQTQQLSAETSRRLAQAGNISELDADIEDALFEQARVEGLEAETDVLQAKQELQALMGLINAGDFQWKLPRRLPEPPPVDEDVGGLEARALDERLDLAAAQQEIQSLTHTLGLQKKTALISEAAVGVDTEREPDGTRVTGPTISVPIPIFDLGQAGVSGARYRLREAQRRYDALRQQARAEVILAHTRMTRARQRFEHFRFVVLPLQHRILEQSQLHYNAMLLGVNQLLEAKQKQVLAARDSVAALQDYWTARANLERAMGGRLASPPPTAPATIPMPMPASQPAADPSAHQHH